MATYMTNLLKKCDFNHFISEKKISFSFPGRALAFCEFCSGDLTLSHRGLAPTFPTFFLCFW